jgi:glutathione S-transferase
MEIRNPSFQWRPDHPRLRFWLEPLAARPAFAATAPPANALQSDK